ncbi:hypothetical protein E4A48_05545 [Xanthomonas cerealis pv. cerealis]|uniref:Uncharacterized protein n=1 Tax=Xanthomonas cerealis pv. cerealis TaxID=152263 RepID=A0A514EB12_9XANT|nr:hypothetical protein [Xanthomonas translucens]QDI03231.1 hypothetical protein E4A48_05545 [Xanthomonas translucens pv. cerealis]
MAAKLWEDTVVTALRDAQWINCKGFALPQTFPPGFVKMDGNAESALGDLLYSSGERYYLIEVKSGRDEVPTEWIEKGKYKEKVVYASLRTLWEELADASEKNRPKDKRDQLLDFFLKSISCHHVSYWNPWTAGGIATGEAVLEPYMVACLDLFDPEGPAKGKGMLKWNNNDFRIGSTVNGTLLGARAIPVRKIFHETSCAFSVKKINEKFHVVSATPLGLPLDEFESYINTLTDIADGEALDLHAIVLSNTGTTFKVVSTTDDLKSIFSPSAPPERSPEQKLEVLIPPSSFDFSQENLDNWRRKRGSTFK